MRPPRIAVVHDWLLTWFGGSERVVGEILNVFPEADVFAILESVPPGERQFLRGKRVRTSFLQKLPGVRRYYRHLLPLMPLAVESLDVSAYDLVISSSHAVAKGVLTNANQMHVCYCHSPIRYAWDLQNQYLAESGLDKGLRKLIAITILHYLRLWDLRTPNAVDFFLANSHFVSRRIEKIYGRTSQVLHPPVDVEAFGLGERKENYYVVVSRLVPYKRISLLAQAFEQLHGRSLIVIGDGPLLRDAKKDAPSNVQYVGAQNFDSMRRYLQHARAFLYASEEDFGISIVEAQACGTPVIAYGSGGALETVVPGKTGLLFYDQTPQSVAAAIREFEARESNFIPAHIRQHAFRFSRQNFREGFSRFVMDRCLDSVNPVLREWAQQTNGVTEPIRSEASSRF